MCRQVSVVPCGTGFIPGPGSPAINRRAILCRPAGSGCRPNPLASVPSAPQGRATIAHRFNGGYTGPLTPQSPAGATEDPGCVLFHWVWPEAATECQPYPCAGDAWTGCATRPSFVPLGTGSSRAPVSQRSIAGLFSVALWARAAAPGHAATFFSSALLSPDRIEV
jgi:hypothetical protein